MKSADIKKANILYVDDEESNLHVFRSIYYTKHNVFTAKSATEGLAVLEKTNIQIIITDQRMPLISGVEFLKRVIEEYPDTIRIILTGYSDIEVIIDAINSCGIYRYFTKPWEVDEMNMAMDRALEIYGLRKENRQLIESLQYANEGLEKKVVKRTRELEVLNGLLEKKVAERTFQLELKNQELERKNNKLEEYAFFNAHKLRSPVATLLGLVAIIESKPSYSAETNDILLKIKSSAQSLDEIVRNIQRNLEGK